MPRFLRTILQELLYILDFFLLICSFGFIKTKLGETFTKWCIRKEFEKLGKD